MNQYNQEKKTVHFDENVKVIPQVISQEVLPFDPELTEVQEFIEFNDTPDIFHLEILKTQK
jgi:hypothetical protein